MTLRSLWAAAAIVVAANAFALVHAARNRAGNPEAELSLTTHELRSSGHSDDNSEVSLDLIWTDPDARFSYALADARQPWLDRDKLIAVGFDVSVDPSRPEAQRFYDRQRPRRVFAALEYDGPGWQAARQAFAAADERNRARGITGADSISHASHLVPVDADTDPVRLRSRHPDRMSVAIVPAVVALDLLPAPGPAQLHGRLQQIPSSIHAPLPLSNKVPPSGAPIRARIRWGALYEPWVEAIEPGE